MAIRGKYIAEDKKSAGADCSAWTLNQQRAVEEEEGSGSGDVA